MSSRFEKLEVWRLAHKYTLKVYKISSKFPSSEKYGLTSQIRRSSSAVPTNIVEGNGRKSKKEYIQFLYTAKASLAESKYQLILARDLKHIQD